MLVRRMLAAGVAALGLVAATVAPAHAIDVPVPTPGLVWTVDGSGDAQPLAAGTEGWTCGIGRSKLVKNHYDDFFGNIEIHVITKACHAYVPETREFYVENRMFVCERFAATNGQCEAGTGYSGAQVQAASSHLEFRADGGNYLYDVFNYTMDEQLRNGLEAGGMVEVIYSEPLDGAVGHRYNAWGYGQITIDGASADMSSDRISKSPEQYVS